MHLLIVLYAGNARHLRALLAAATKLSAFLQQPQGTGAGSSIGAAPAAGRAMTVNDFLFAAGLDHVNMFSLVRCPASCLPSCRVHTLQDGIAHKTQDIQEHHRSTWRNGTSASVPPDAAGT